VAVFSLDLFLNQVIRYFHFPAEIGIAETSIASIVFAILLIALTGIDMPDRPDRTSARLVKSGLSWLRFPVLTVAAVIIAASVLGYVALGRFLAGQVLLTGCGFVALLLCHLAIRALTADPRRWARPVSSMLGREVAIDKDRGRQVLGGIAFILNFILLTLAAGLLLLSWGFSDAVLLGWLKSLFFGFEIGQFRISLFKILIAAALFVLVIVMTRLLQRWISSNVLTEKRVDSGIANSIRQGIGYAGLALAALISVSYIGLDVTNLAIVAGALSVGIGFGLQSIVNNFVSGLILLVERPVKVGDWIVVGANQGFVRRISVRATEIETFDRASVIVPNSELITGTVQNWTHRNAMGRLVVNVGASYNADPEHVTAVLKRVAEECDELLKYPEPWVAFEDFGSSSLDFSLRCYIADVKKTLIVKTSLRMAIFAAFKKEGIEIPFPQQDVHLRDLDFVRSALQRVAEQRLKEAAGTEPPAGGDTERADRRSTPVDVPSSGGASSPGSFGESDPDSGPASS
jgi:small-conductance mechanosensitive channel